MFSKIPLPVQNTLKTLSEAGFEAYIVGGCVRDLLLNRTPRDWDITTSALPEEITALFPESFYENTFGTVGVKVPYFTERKDIAPSDETKEIIEVTTYRTESAYTDKRRPSVVSFTTSLEARLGSTRFYYQCPRLRERCHWYMDTSGPFFWTS